MRRPDGHLSNNHQVSIQEPRHSSKLGAGKERSRTTTAPSTSYGILGLSLLTGAVQSGFLAAGAGCFGGAEAGLAGAAAAGCWDCHYSGWWGDVYGGGCILEVVVWDL